MTFIKLEEVVINTSYIAAVRFESYSLASENRVSLLVAIPTTSLQQETPSQGLYHYEWMEFTGDAAKALRDYFSSFNNVIDLLPQDRSPVCCGNSQFRRGTHPR
jgi:ribonuclease I